MKACTFTAVAVLAGTVAAQDLYSNLSSLNHTCVIRMYALPELIKDS